MMLQNKHFQLACNHFQLLKVQCQSQQEAARMQIHHLLCLGLSNVVTYLGIQQVFSNSFFADSNICNRNPNNENLHLPLGLRIKFLSTGS